MAPSSSAARSHLTLVRADVEPEATSDPSERRVHPRLTLSELDWLNTVRLKYGPVVSLIDLSTGGAQIETSSRLQPGAVVVVQISGPDGEVAVPSNVLRCHVSQVTPFPMYRSALSFKRAFDTPQRPDSERGSDPVANLVGEHARMTGALRKLSHARAEAGPISVIGEGILTATLALIQAPAGRRADVRFRQDLTQIFRELTRRIESAAQPEDMLGRLAERLRRSVPTKTIRILDGARPIGPHGPDTIYFDASNDDGVIARLVVEFPGNCQLEEWHLHFLKIAAQLVALVSEIGRLRAPTSVDNVAEPEPAAAVVAPEAAPVPDAVVSTPAVVVSPPPAPAGASDSPVPASTAWIRVVARYADGPVLKGHARGFTPSRGILQVSPTPDAPPSSVVTVPLRHLKAVFFVNDLEGAPFTMEPNSAQRGRNIVVTFTDGEVLTGTTLNYTIDGPGFFLTPHEQRGNNIRIFVVAAAVRQVQFP
jgi:hypothetical protein